MPAPLHRITTMPSVWTPPGVKHWHGATKTNAVSHYTVQESVDGKNAEWMEKVSDEEYGR